MKFLIPQASFEKALKAAGKGVSEKDTHAFSSGVLLIADKCLTLQTYNLAIGVTHKADCSVEEIGGFVAPYKALFALVSRFPSEEVIEIEATTAMMTLRVVGAVYTIQSLCLAEDFPALPEAGEPVATLTVDTFRDAVSRTIFAASHEIGKPMLCGVEISCKKGKISFSAADGAKASFYDVQGGHETDFQHIVPVDNIKMIAAIPAAQGSTLTISYSGGLLGFQFTNTVVTSNLIDGKLPDFRASIPSESDYVLVLDRQALISAVDRLTIAANHSTSVIKLAGGEVDPYCSVFHTNDSLSGSEKLQIEEASDIDGAFEMAFMSKFLSQVLAGQSGEMVAVAKIKGTGTMSFTDPSDPDSLLLLAGVVTKTLA